MVWGAELARCCLAGGGIRRGGLGALYPWEQGSGDRPWRIRASGSSGRPRKPYHHQAREWNTARPTIRDGCREWRCIAKSSGNSHKATAFSSPVPSRELQVANRELGTVERVSDSGNLELRMDSGREVRFNIREHPHLDHGYAVTSHSSHGQAADRVLIHLDSDKTKLLVNDRFAYVSVSRA
jgi:hypothetical protein